MSYERETSEKNFVGSGQASVEQESSSVQVAYTMGGMTLGVAMNDHTNAAYTQNNDIKDTVFTVQMAF